MPPLPEGADCSDARAILLDAAGAGTGLGGAGVMLLCRCCTLEAQPINGTAKKLAAVSPKKSLRVAITSTLP
jgi:hypothetical protein